MSSAPESSTHSSRPWVPPSAAELHALLPEYEIVKLLGRGGMGAVYMGRQISLDRPVAIKILSSTLDEADASFAERFKNEARAMAKLTHPGIVAVHDFGEKDGGLLYIVMEYIEGTDVARMIAKEGRLHTEHAMAITAHVCDALAYAHGRGIIHRDIKPANVMVGYDGVVKVADFGLAKMTHSNATGLTQSGMAMGTLHYMAPEALVLGAAVDHRADLYAVGVMLYQMLTGKIPQGMFRLPSLRVSGLDPRYDGIITKALMEEREARYQSAGELRRDLDAILTQPVVKVEESAQEDPAVLPAQARPQSSGRTAKRLLPPSSVMQPVPVPKGKVGLHEALVLMGSVILFGGMLIGGLVWLTQPRGQPVAAVDTTQATRLAQEKTAAEEKQQQMAADVEAARIAKEKADTVEKQRQMAAQLEREHLLKEAAMKTQAVADVFSIGKIGDTRMMDLGNGRKLTLCYIPPGSFTMGSPASEVARSDNEEQVQVHISRGYWLAKTECTQAEWSAVMGTTPSSFKGDDLPVEQVSWQDAQAFMAKMNSKNVLPVNWKWSLPSEAQWEYACRAGKTESLWAPDQETWGFINADHKTHPVGTKTANAWGLNDMCGNVYEWCLDAWDGKSKLPGGTDPVGKLGLIRVYRGSSWCWHVGNFPRSAFRSGFSQGTSFFDLGFRPAVIQVETGSVDALVARVSSAVTPLPPITNQPIAGVSNPAVATTEKPFINSFGMKFVPVPITGGSTDTNTSRQKVLFSVWDTRVQDYARFVRAKGMSVVKPEFSQTDEHPAVNVAWENAKAFCVWLTQSEQTAGWLPAGCMYRLPTDHEWSCAVGIGEREDARASPESKDRKIGGVFPWGSSWPPPIGAGNYAATLRTGGYGFTATAPVGSFAANQYGLYDMGGNVWQWCEEAFYGVGSNVLRGAAWNVSDGAYLLSSFRNHGSSGEYFLRDNCGFRCVLFVPSMGN